MHIIIQSKKNNVYIPNKLNVVYYGDFVIICPNYQFGKNRIVPGNGGFKHSTEGIIVKITVTSTEYPISIINNDYVVILSKTEYTPKIVDTDKIYLSKVYFTPPEKDVTFYHVMYTGKYKENLDAIHDIVEISDIYDNTAYTIAKICNKLAEINNTFSFDVLSGTSFTFHFSINFKPEYLPILFTKSNKYKNMFTVDYLDRYFNYYAGGFDWWYSTFSQTIDFTTTADTVTITKRVYYADGSKDNSQVVFSPSKSPYILYCPATDDFTRTIAGQTASKNCPTGYTGSITRKCSETGVWENIYSNCQQIACEAADNFTRTLAGQTATKNCPTGYTGNQTRYCNEDGKWENTNSTSCKVISCPVNNNWPSTKAMSTASIKCPTGYTGMQTRYCNEDGKWGNIDSTSCKKDFCTSEIYSGISWPETIAGKSVSISCPTGYIGSQTRFCNENGTWENINSTSCKVITNSSESISFCPADDVWQVTKVGDIAKVSCDNGGEKSRECLEGGIWGDIDTSNCSDETKYCSEDGEWERTESGNISKQNCLFGLSEKTRRCNTDGIWEDEDSSSCNNMYIIIGIIICICVLFFIIIIIKVSRSHSSVNNLSSDTI